MDNDQSIVENERDKIAYVVVVYFIRFRNHPSDKLNSYVNYMRNTFEFIAALSNVGILTPSFVPNEWIGEVAPDVCATCSYSFGLTKGGRLRQGCYFCRNSRDSLADHYSIQRLSEFLKIGQSKLEAIIAKAIDKHSRINKDANTTTG